MITPVIGLVLLFGGVMLLIQVRPFWALVFILLAAGFLAGDTLESAITNPPTPRAATQLVYASSN